MQDVSLIQCRNYESANVTEALDRVVAPFGGWAGLVKPGDRVLLKPNLLGPRPPEAAATTHPMIVEAVARRLLEAGATVKVGDSSGGIIGGMYPTEETLTVSGIRAVCERLGIEAVNFDTFGTETIPVQNGFISELIVSRAALEADKIINVAKLKTHTGTLMTGGVKNMFGVVPGTRKTGYHREAGFSGKFEQILVDIYRTVTPDFTIVDAVTAMEGNGPANGSPKPVGLIMGGPNAFAVDAIGCRIMGLDPSRVLHQKLGVEQGLGPNPAQVNVLGDPVRLPVTPRFALPSNWFSQNTPTWVTGWILRALKYSPECDPQKCIQCEMCVDSCPVEAIRFNEQGQMLFAREKCIECFCCQEFCPEGAIALKQAGLMGRVITAVARIAAR
ncbi:MAG: DUF362 domain-containing protein [Solirubrobacterales bacterium]